MQSNNTEDHIRSDLQRNDLEYNSEGLSPSGSDKNSRNPLLSETEKCGVCGAAAAKHGVKYLVFFSPHIPSKLEKNTLVLLSFEGNMF